MSELSDYTITLYKNRILGCWGWRAETPDGRTLTPPLGGMFASKAAAEQHALNHIQADRATEQISGDELKRRVAEHPTEGVKAWEQGLPVSRSNEA